MLKEEFSLINKVEICGVNTAKLPVISNEEQKELLKDIKNGNMIARETFINGNLRFEILVYQYYLKKGISTPNALIPPSLYLYNQSNKPITDNYTAAIFAINSSTAIPCTMAASSSVSPCAEGHPRQCIPISISTGAMSGLIRNASPIVVSFAISAIIIIYLLFHLYLCLNSITRKPDSCKSIF